MAKVTMLAADPGEARDRLELTLRLTPEGRIAPNRGPDEDWAVCWIRADGETQAGELVRVESGWAVRQHSGDDDPVCPLQVGVLRPGESVTLREPDGGRTEFRVVAVEQD